MNILPPEGFESGTAIKVGQCVGGCATQSPIEHEIECITICTLNVTFIIINEVHVYVFSQDLLTTSLDSCRNQLSLMCTSSNSITSAPFSNMLPAHVIINFI